MQCIDNNQTYLVISKEDFQLELNLFQILYQLFWNKFWNLQHFFPAQIGIKSLFEKLTLHSNLQSGVLSVGSDRSKSIFSLKKLLHSDALKFQTRSNPKVRLVRQT